MGKYINDWQNGKPIGLFIMMVMVLMLSFHGLNSSQFFMQTKDENKYIPVRKR